MQDCKHYITESFKNKTQVPVSFMNIRDFRVEIAEVEIEGAQCYYLILANKNYYENIVFSTRFTRDRWIQLLFRWCVFGGFHKFFIEGKVLGSGNYGVVRTCTRIGESEETFAVKSYIKSKIVKSETKVNLDYHRVCCFQR